MAGENKQKLQKLILIGQVSLISMSFFDLRIYVLFMKKRWKLKG